MFLTFYSEKCAPELVLKFIHVHDFAVCLFALNFNAASCAAGDVVKKKVKTSQRP